MININDEMLNQFLDNQLSGDEKEIVKNAIANSSELKRKYDTLISTDKLLRNVENDSTSLSFSSTDNKGISYIESPLFAYK